MKLHLPNPTTPVGALIYSVVGSGLFTGALELAHHIHVIWS